MYGAEKLFYVNIIRDDVKTTIALSVWVLFSITLPWPLKFPELFFEVSQPFQNTVHRFQL